MPPICKHDSCSEKSYFDIKGKGKGSYCKEHKLEGMVYIKGKRCAKDGCSAMSPAYNIENGKGKFCKEHKLDGMIDVKNKKM